MNATDDGIDINGGDVTVSRVTSTDHGNDAFEINDATLVATDVTTANSDDGMEFNAGATATVTGFSATGHRFDGFDVDNDSVVTLDTATIDGNDDNGIEIHDTADVTIFNATVLNSQDLGIRIGSNATDTPTVQISSSTVSNNGSVFGEAGIDIAGAATVTIDGATISNNEDDGIELTGSGASLTLLNSTITGNGANGVEITNSPALVNLGDAVTAGGNTIKDNGQFFYNLNDSRPAGELVVITSYGNDLGGAGAAPTGVKVGFDFDTARYIIIGAGNPDRLRPLKSQPSLCCGSSSLSSRLPPLLFSAAAMVSWG